MARKKGVTVEDLKLQIKQKRNELKQTEQQLRALELEDDARLGRMVKSVFGRTLTDLDEDIQEDFLYRVWKQHAESNQRQSSLELGQKNAMMESEE